MARRRSQSDAERFTRHQRLLNVLRSRDSFRKSDIFDLLKVETKAFVGRVIGELMRAGYLTKRGPGTNPGYAWSEKQEEFDVGRWIESRVFAPTVKRSPSPDRPRERLMRLGAHALKTSELLAILVRSGLQGESAVQAGEKLAALFGDDLERLSLQGRGELNFISRAIGETAYSQLMAALELGKRLANQRAAHSVVPSRIQNSGEALAYCKDHFSRLTQEAEQEELHVVLLDGRHHVIKTERITVGLLNQSLIHPREVFKAAIRESASALILVHNHPDGDPNPSQDDRTVTRELRKAGETLGIRLMDHIILCKDKALSMVEERLL